MSRRQYSRDSVRERLRRCKSPECAKQLVVPPGTAIRPGNASWFDSRQNDTLLSDISTRFNVRSLPHVSITITLPIVYRSIPCPSIQHVLLQAILTLANSRRTTQYQEPREIFSKSDGHLIVKSTVMDHVDQIYRSWDILETILAELREWSWRQWNADLKCRRMKWVVERYDPYGSPWAPFQRFMEGSIERSRGSEE